MAFANWGAGIYRELTLVREADVLCIGIARWVRGTANAALADFRWRNDTDAVDGDATGKLSCASAVAEHQTTIFIGFFPATAAGTKRFFPQSDGITGADVGNRALFAFALY